MSRLEGKTALVTGGASGIGEGVVRLFLAEGARVVVADIDTEGGGALADELGDDAAFVQTDVSRAEDVEAAVRQTVERFGALDVVVNNAGFYPVDTPIEDLSVEAFDRAMGVLVRGVFLGMKYATPVMKAQGGGSIVNTASITGLVQGARPTEYAAAKAAVIQLTRSVARELGPFGIRVNCVCPGPVATPLYARMKGVSRTAGAYLTRMLERGFADVQPLPRAGRPADVARAVLWLASDDADFITGDALVVDGGYTCQPRSIDDAVQKAMMGGLG